jgi:hypothetical protein
MLARVRALPGAADVVEKLGFVCYGMDLVPLRIPQPLMAQMQRWLLRRF